jgi:hypothetical protein
MDIRLRSVALFVFLVFAPVSAIAQNPRARVVEGAVRGQTANDPVINPSSTSRHPGLPPGALTGSNEPDTAEKEKTWAAARWTTSTLQLPSNTKKIIPVTRPSTLLIRASRSDSSDLTLTVTKGHLTLKSVTGTTVPGVGRVATARVEVPAAGHVVITAGSAGSAKVTLDVGVVARQ